jgi:hypothetical protein
MTENSKLIAELLARRRQQISRLAEHQGVIETIRADVVQRALAGTTSIPPVSQVMRTSKPVPGRDKKIVPPQDIPDGRNSMAGPIAWPPH